LSLFSLASSSLDEDARRTIRRIHRASIVAVCLFSLGAAVWGTPFLIGVVGGGVVSIIGFASLVRLVERLTQARPTLGSWLSILGVLFRYILLSLALFVIIGVWHANVVAVALGLSAPVAAIFVEAGLRLYRELRSGT
jgi:hypothetical protein